MHSINVITNVSILIHLSVGNQCVSIENKFEADFKNSNASVTQFKGK
jgi:hypothetical protein